MLILGGLCLLFKKKKWIMFNEIKLFFFIMRYSCLKIVIIDKILV